VVSTKVSAWNAGAAALLVATAVGLLAAGAVGAGEAVAAGVVPGAVMAVLDSERAGLADVPLGDGRAIPEEPGGVPAHPAASRPAAMAVVNARTAATGRRSGRTAV
jgi:hypothetical protein